MTRHRWLISSGILGALALVNVGLSLVNPSGRGGLFLGVALMLVGIVAVAVAVAGIRRH